MDKVLSHGLVDGDEPPFIPSGKVTALEWYSVGAIFYMDMTDYDKTVGRGDRTWDFWEIDFPTELRHALRHYISDVAERPFSERCWHFIGGMTASFLF